MSRSLRTRPMTLYNKDDQPVVPSIPASASYSSNNARAGPSRTDANHAAAPHSSGSVLRKSRKKASEVGSNLKKRLSMRYAEPTTLGPGGFSAIPEVPSLPPMPQIQVGQTITHQSDGTLLPIMGDGFAEGFKAEQGGLRPRGSSDTARSGTENFADDPAIDLNLLSQDDFDPQAYIRAKLPHHSESSLRTFKASLAGAKDAANEDLKRQVFKNYAEFIIISKEIATLENDMLELKELLAEWKQLPQALELDDSSGTSAFSDFSRGGKGGRGNRTSMIDLQQIYRAQITSLWEGIEGSQKFLPYVPGRHLIAEASTFTELNSATYKPKQSVALFLLDDLLLIAVRKKRQMSSKVRLVAERCFSLAEIVVIDLKDGGDLTNAIKVRRGKETYVYRSDRSEDKKALLNAFKRVAEELATKRRKENSADAEARKRESTLLSPGLDQGGMMSASGRRDGAEASRLLTSIGEEGSVGGGSSVLAAAAASAASERKDPGRWNNDFADELAVCIALREWEEAVSLVERGKSVLSTYSPSEMAFVDLSNKLAARTQDLVTAISTDFGQQSLKKSTVVRNVGYLLRLDKGEKARELFLSARTDLLKRRTRQIKFEGDVSLYISELALVHFTLIKNTSEWYMSAFKDNRMASGFVQWASTQVEAYGEMFRRQVYGVDQDPKVISECLEISRSSAAQLKEVGLDFSYLIEELLRPEGMAKPIPALTLTTAEEPHQSSPIRASAQEIRRQSMMQLS
ncbi:exocyst complex component exo84 [Thecaphora frezii]